jgi:hypothetical protein
MNPDTLCMGCMCERGVAEACARCHYRYGTPAETPLVLPPGTILNSNCLIGKKLGQGGFGITYIGYDFVTNRRLAIKEYFPREISTRGEDRHTVSPISRANKDDLDYGLLCFEEEAHKLAKFKDHPGIVSFLDFFKANGTGYIVMGYVEGDTLRKRLHERGERISFDEALQILSQVMKALEDVHREYILHRDISPENIYIERDGNVRLLDFGAAKQALSEQSQSLSVILRPGYAPEEQYRRKGHQGPWTDIYALGATFYRSITGKVPTESPDRLHKDDLEPPRRLGVSMPARSEAALLKALAVRAEKRFQSARELRTAITPRTGLGKVLPPIGTIVTPKHLSKPLLLAALMVSFVTVFGLNVAGDLTCVAQPVAYTSNNCYVAAEIYPLLGLFALMLFTFWRMWKSIQDGHARTGPDKAVAFCFIPVFNLYWAFPIMWGFSVDYNRYLSRHQLDGRKLPEDLFLLATIAYVGTCIIAPFSRDVFSFLIVLNAILLCIALAKTCDAVNALGPPSGRTSLASVSVPNVKALSLYCVAGQYVGQHVEVNQQAIIIGRDPARSNLVLSSDKISATHAKVWREALDGGVWIEDLKSTNGTFYQKAASDGLTVWIQLSGSTLLAQGDLFQLSQETAVFEVRQV